MRFVLVPLLCISLLGCESQKDRAIKEARNRPPDAGMAVAPYPKDATLICAGQNVPRDLKIDGPHLYWLNEGHRAEGKAGVFRVEKNGGEPQQLLDGKGFTSLTVAGDYVYATNALNDAVVRVPKGGGNMEPVVELGGPFAVANDGSDVVIMAEDGVVKVPLAGGKPALVTEGGAGAQWFQMEGTQAYWYAPIAGKIIKLGVPSKKAAPFVEQDMTLHALAVNGGDVFWMLGNDNRVEVRKMPVGGGKPTTLATGQRVPIFMSADSSNVYWTTGDDVMKVSRAGGTPEPAVKGTDRSISVAADDSHVYWTDRFGRIQRVAK